LSDLFAGFGPAKSSARQQHSGFTSTHPDQVTCAHSARHEAHELQPKRLRFLSAQTGATHRGGLWKNLHDDSENEEGDCVCGIHMRAP